MPSTTIRMLKNIFTSHGGCGCGRPKPKEVFQPKSKPKPKPEPELDIETNTSLRHDQKICCYHCCHSSSSSWESGVGGGNSVDNDDDHTSTTHSFNNTSTNCSDHGHQSHDPSGSATELGLKSPQQVTKFGDSVAIIKDSEDPYQDFRQSMLQMIMEKEIYSKHDLQELLDCFLELNSSSHHKSIVEAFMDIWNGFIRLKEA